VKLIYYIDSCKVRYFKPLFVVIVMIMVYRYETFSQYSMFEFGVFISVINNHQNYNK